MKKNLIAMAIAAAVAAPAAMADVKISGFVLQEFIFDDNTGNSGINAVDDGLENASDVSVIFTASEDLGDGMKAFAKIDYENDDRGTVNGNDQFVGLAGSFGTITVGAFEDFTEGKVAAMASVDSSDTLSVEMNGGNNTGRQNGGVKYVSPNMSGFQIGVAGFAVNGASDSTFDATDIMLAYKSGPITARLAFESEDLGNAGVDQDTTSLGLEYKAGAVRVVGVVQDVDNAGNATGQDRTGWMIGGNYTAGANKFGLGYMNDEDSNTTEDTRWIADFTHNMSKRTKAFVTYASTDNSGATADTNVFAVGMRHAF